MNILPTILSLIVLIFFLVKSADLLEDSFVGVSKKLGVNTFVVGFLILAMTSSLPETFVAINAAANDYSSLSVGNIVGATILILTLVLGLSAIKNGRTPFRGLYSTKEVLISLAIIYVQIIALIDGKLVWMEGFFLITIYTAFLIYIIGKSRVLDLSKHRNGASVPLIFAKGVLGVFGLIITSNLTVAQSISLAHQISIPPVLIGLLGISIGTSLPELTILLRSHNKETNTLAAGNFIGSATFNTAVLGLLTILNPTILRNFTSLVPAIMVLSIVIFMFSLMVINDRDITRREGFILLFTFILYIILEVFLNFR
ncbi:sodium:calcium antiporter [Candidatus Dojkabacteria bacterium]|nr:sodium:calcium antiporter [Candidatus Dojkabacteria bacterium]